MNLEEEYELCGNASGSLVGSPNTVVTAQHVIEWTDEKEKLCSGASIWVGYNFDPKAEFFVWWPAEVRRESEDQDLAVLTVDLTAEPWIEDESIAFGALLAGDWPTLDVAPMEEEPQIGDPVQLYSYPGIGSYSVTYTSGHLAGWSYDDTTETDAGIMKLDMTVAGGSSGSGLLDSEGRLIGLIVMGGVTRFPAGDERNDIDWVDCRHAADTNGDELIDDEDTCLPTGGFINGAVSLFPLRQFLIGTGVTW
jgi:V8-like Glu-specific endopeptidase